MFALEFWSGVGLLAVAAVALSPYWWPPLKDEIRQALGNARRSANAFVAAVPGRWAKAKAHWREAKDYRRKGAILSFLCTIGVGWMLWVHHSHVPMPDESHAFRLLFFGIGLGTMFAGLGAGYFALLTISWVWEGVRGPRAPSLPAVNPMNRVGMASPLGEARFATAWEIDSALAGRGGHFVPPKFRE